MESCYEGAQRGRPLLWGWGGGGGGVGGAGVGGGSGTKSDVAQDFDFAESVAE